jgi:hypothetical protein
MENNLIFEIYGSEYTVLLIHGELVENNLIFEIYSS